MLPVPEYEGIYWVSNDGYVFNGRKALKPSQINSGYLSVGLSRQGRSKSFLLHRLVALAFLPNPDNKAEVNHKNGIKSDCSLGNLEWVTSSENKRHSLDTGLKQYNLPTLGIKKGKGSKYHNVIWDKSREKWIGVVRQGKKNYFQKRFDTEEEAALHVNWIIDELGLTDRPKNIVI